MVLPIRQASAKPELNACCPLMQIRRNNDIWQGENIGNSLQALHGLHETAKGFAKTLIHDILVFCSKLMDSASGRLLDKAVIKALDQALIYSQRFKISSSVLSELNCSLGKLRLVVKLMLKIAWFNTAMSELGGGPYGYKTSMAQMVRYLKF